MPSFGAPRASLRFVAPDGTAWTVREFDAHTFHGCERACLVFECDAAMRRVLGYPSDWESLGVDALLALSWRR